MSTRERPHNTHAGRTHKDLPISVAEECVHIVVAREPAPLQLKPVGEQRRVRLLSLRQQLLLLTLQFEV